MGFRPRQSGGKRYTRGDTAGCVLADSKKGRNIIRLVSRNTNDRQHVATRGAELLDLLSERRAYKRVDMIRGPLRKDQTFYR